VAGFCVNSTSVLRNRCHRRFSFCRYAGLALLLQVLRVREQIQNARLMNKTKSAATVGQSENQDVLLAGDQVATSLSGRYPPSAGLLDDIPSANTKQTRIAFGKSKAQAMVCALCCVTGVFCGWEHFGFVAFPAKRAGS
jgi:hypothetical protein